MYEITSQGLANIDQDDSGILEALMNEPKSLEQLMDETELPEEIVKNALAMFISQGFIRKTLSEEITPRPILPKPQRDEGYITFGSLSPGEMSRRNPL